MTNDVNARAQQDLPANDLGLSPERLAALEPALRALLRDFERLEELITPTTEPAPTPELEGYADERR
ncbi:MAG TPA: hypothetical protein VFI42_16295 [Thermomicrobiaceae bacterium]|nr:hypothetical protein [Thermomicrobiaceae bacterium]